MSWFEEGNVAQCRRCFRNIQLLVTDAAGFREWRPYRLAGDRPEYPQDCPSRPGEPCTPHQPE